METLLFACGHENPVPNRYCNICGATRDPRCPLCKSPNRREAKFCGACGTRLPDEGAAPETIAASSPPQSSQLRRVPVTRSVNVVGASAGSGPRGAGTRGWRRDDVLSSPSDDVAREDDEWEADSQRRPKLLRLAAVAGLAAVTVVFAVALTVLHVSPTRRGDDRGDAVAERESTPAVRGERPPAPAATHPASSTGDSATTTPRVATGPSAHEATDAPATPRMPDRVASPELPPRSPGQTTASAEDETPRTAAPRAPGPAAQTSVEKMADFLIEQLGPESAAEKARSTAAWYDADRSEHTFWQRVGDAIKRRSGS